MKNLYAELNRRIMILDGAMGSEIISRNIDESQYHLNEFTAVEQPLKGCYESLCISRPDIIENIHAEYLQSGADIIETNTFNANVHSLQKYGLEEYDRLINLKSAQLARQVVDNYLAKTGKQCYVAGAVGPGNTMISDKDSEDFQAAVNAYYRQASALIEGSVDLILLETIVSLTNAEAAYIGIQKAMESHGKTLPIICSAVVNNEGNLFDGSTLSDFADFCISTNAFAVGLNCGSNIENTLKSYSILANNEKFSDKYLILFPSAGLPDKFGKYTESDRVLSMLDKEINQRSTNIIGGCCGTTPKFIQALSAKASTNKPRPVKNKRNAD